MAFSEERKKEIGAVLDAWLEKNRPPVEVREQLDFGWRIEEQSVFLCTVRPDYMEPSIKRHHDFAKATYVRTEDHWNILWLRASGKWELYEPRRQVKQLPQFLKEVNDDPYSWFKG